MPAEDADMCSTVADHYLPGTNSLHSYAEGYGYESWLNAMGWDAYGATDPPHGSNEQPNTLAAVLRHPDVSGAFYEATTDAEF